MHCHRAFTEKRNGCRYIFPGVSYGSVCKSVVACGIRCHQLIIPKLYKWKFKVAVRIGKHGCKGLFGILEFPIQIHSHPFRCRGLAIGRKHSTCDGPCGLEHNHHVMQIPVGCGQCARIVAHKVGIRIESLNGDIPWSDPFNHKVSI